MDIPPFDCDVTGTCAAFNARKLARTLTNRYDSALEACGINSTQFSLLFAVSSYGLVPVSSLSAELGTDRTTLSRNIKLLEGDGMIRINKGEDSRQRLASLTNYGQSRLRQAIPLWQAVQKEVNAPSIMKALRKVAV